MIDLIAQVLPGTETFESAAITKAIGAGGLSAFLLALGFWIKRYIPEGYTGWIPAILMVVGILIYGIYSGWTLSALIMAFLASNAAVGIYEGSRATKNQVRPAKE
jgi:hypothetical protein